MNDRRVRDAEVPELGEDYVRRGRAMLRAELARELAPSPFASLTVGDRVRDLERRAEMTEALVYGGLTLLFFIFIIAVARR